MSDHDLTFTEVLALVDQAYREGYADGRDDADLFEPVFRSQA